MKIRAKTIFFSCAAAALGFAINLFMWTGGMPIAQDILKYLSELSTTLAVALAGFAIILPLSIVVVTIDWWLAHIVNRLFKRKE